MMYHDANDGRGGGGLLGVFVSEITKLTPLCTTIERGQVQVQKKSKLVQNNFFDIRKEAIGK